MANKCCIALLSIINVGVALQTNVLQYAPQGKGGIWIDTEEINQKNGTLGVEKNSLLQVVGVPYFTQERERGPKCFACSGLECAIPRQTGQNAELQCDYGDVCWTIETIEREPNAEAIYFRGCGRVDKQKCAGNEYDRPPSRSTAGQRKEANGPEYCDWSTSISQCKSCCVTDYCNGARLFTGLTGEAMDSLKNGAGRTLSCIGFDGVSHAAYESAFRRGCFIAVIWWITLVITFPPPN